MRLLRSSLKRLVALIALAAVLLGAFEHEDLIFQDADRNDPASVATHPERLSAPQPDTGTEGVFRSDSHRLWLSPRPGLILATGLHVIAFARWLAVVPLDPPVQRGFIGLVALRL